MNISYNWLKEYLKTDLSVQKIAEIITDIGLTVDGIEKIETIKGSLQGLVVGEVLTCQQHPNADKLKVTTVNVGSHSPEPLQIVCGAPNVAQGQKVVVAMVGTVLYPADAEPVTIQKGKIRGETSMGMICAEDEIGIGANHEGIIVLPPTIRAGAWAADYYKPQTDFVLDVDITPNRSDAMCHIGVAKDLHAALQVNFQYPKNAFTMPDVSQFKVDNKDFIIEVEVQNTELCPRYSGVTISNVEVKESPEWLKNRLKTVGIAPINNVVDITNYVQNELGQPLHAFDAHQIKGNKVVVTTLPANTPFVALDGTTYKLHATDLVICDADLNPMCIAGVFGGKNSGISANTTHVFLESAYFDPASVRTTSFVHNLRTDAVQKFEKGTDITQTEYALKRAALLIQSIAGGTISSPLLDVYPQPQPPQYAILRYARLNQIAGITFSASKVKQIIQALNLNIAQETPETLILELPTNKADVLREIDIIEEIIRIYGINNIPIPPFMRVSTSPSIHPNPVQVRTQISSFLVNNGFFEMQNLSLSNSQNYAPEQQPQLATLLGSANKGIDTLRLSLLFSGLEVLQYNQNRQQIDLKLFEIGKVYALENQKDNTQKYTETEQISLFITGNKNIENWQQTPQKNNFYDLKATAEKILERLGIAPQNITPLHNTPELYYGMQYTFSQKKLLTLGLVQPQITQKYDIKNAVFYASFDFKNILNALKQQSNLQYTLPPPYPTVKRDFSLLLNKDTQFAEIQQIATKTAKNILQQVTLFDVFNDESKLGEGKKSYAVSFVFQDPTKTFTDTEIDKIMQKIRHQLEQQLHAVIR